MKVLIGHTQQNMITLVSTRLLFFAGKPLPVSKLSWISKRAGIHTSLQCQNRVDRKDRPLTLSSLGFRCEIETGKNEKPNELGQPSSAIQVLQTKARPLKSSIVKAVNVRTQLEIETEKSEKPNELGRPSSVLQTKVRPLKSSIVKAVNVRTQLEIETENNEKPNELGRPSSVFQTKVRPLKSSIVKAVKVRTPLELEAAPFSAKTFAELNLPPLLIERLESLGLTAPTDVQSTAIPTIAQNHDVVIQSYTGSGKTLAYLLPILSEVGPLKRKFPNDVEYDKKTGVEAVIVAPSRELGMQIVREVEKLLGPVDKKLVQQLVGGANRSRQEEGLKKNKPLIVVGTPGRVAEISAAGKLHTHNCRFLVLDEVDQLLSFNFREDMHRILEHVGKRSGVESSSTSKAALIKRVERQTVMVSATMPFSVIRAARSWGRDPLLVRAKTVLPLDSVTASGGPSSPDISTSNSSSNTVTQGAVDSLPPSLKHYYCVTKLQHKIDSLRRCVHALDAKSVIAFMNHTKRLKDAVFKLEARGMNAAELHGDLGKLARSTTLKKFKNGEVRVLVTNELSARGLDVAECDLVVNLDMPTDSIHYAHRAGRTGRLGRKGSVVSICEESEVFIVKKLRRQLGVDIRACEFTEGNLVVSKEEEKEAVKTLEAAR